MKQSYHFGKFDFYGRGRKINDFVVNVRLEKGQNGIKEFAADGEIWNGRGTDLVSGGQNLDEMRKFLRGNPVFDEIYDLWKKWHLCGMSAGTRRQQLALEQETERRNALHRERKEPEETPLAYASNYDEAVKYLKSAGLYKVDTQDGETVNGKGNVKGYEYGRGWVFQTLTEEAKKRIEGLFALAKEHGVAVI